MTSIVNALAKGLLLVVHALNTRTATGQSASVDLLDYEGAAVIVLDAAAGTGTTPTNAVTFEESDDNSTFTAIPAAEFMEGTNFAGLTTVASQQIRHISVGERKRYLRAVFTIAGTTPSYTFSVTMIAQKKYQ